MSIVTLRDLRVVRYIVTRNAAEVVNDRTQRHHRLLTFDAAGDITVRISPHGVVVAAMSAAELRLIAREHRREMRRRALERLAARFRR